jgi:hypothetical protein
MVAQKKQARHWLKKLIDPTKGQHGSKREHLRRKSPAVCEIFH